MAVLPPKENVDLLSVTNCETRASTALKRGILARVRVDMNLALPAMMVAALTDWYR